MRIDLSNMIPVFLLAVTGGVTKVWSWKSLAPTHCLAMQKRLFIAKTDAGET